MGRASPAFIADFDSASAMARGLAACLHGRDFKNLGFSPLEARLAVLANRLPEALRLWLYARSGQLEGIAPKDIGGIDAEDISQWIVDSYPERRYPAVMIGSSNGAAIHLAAAMGVPWLPQTYLIPVRWGRIDPDEPRRALAAAIPIGRALLEENPDIELHHMHDANQDRLMIRHMAYFRVKRLRLGAVFTRFLRERLVAGGRIYLIEDGYRWPKTKVGDRHYFQMGASGGMEADEYRQGSDRLREFLKRSGSRRAGWDAPEPDCDGPEAEWGFAGALRDDVVAFAADNGFGITRVDYETPEALSPLVADLHRWWYDRVAGGGARPLVIESFILLNPWWTLCARAIPFWTKFNVDPSFAAAKDYIDATDPFARIGALLFPHGTRSVGMTPVRRWRELVDRGLSPGALLGVDGSAYPADFASFGRYQGALEAFATAGNPPIALTGDDLADFLRAHGERYRVGWRDPSAAPRQQPAPEH